MRSTGFGQGHEICADPLELDRGHRDGSGVFGVRDTQVLLVDIHELQIILAQPIAVTALENQIEHIWCILGLERQDIFALGSTKNFRQRCQIDTKGEIAIASIW